MRSALKALIFAVLGTSATFADPQECLPEQTMEKLADSLSPGSIIYRDCYYCEKPSYEEIKVAKVQLKTCHLQDSAGEKALYFDGVILRRFSMEKCGKPQKFEKFGVELGDELLVVNYAWLLDIARGEATNIADLFGSKSHHACPRFMMLQKAPPKTKPPKSRRKSG